MFQGALPPNLRYAPMVFSVKRNEAGLRFF
jgi:hypothetical protein